VNTNSGWYGTPLVEALVGWHFQTAKFLHDNGAHLDAHYEDEDTPLHSAAWYGDVKIVQILLGYRVDVNTQRGSGWTSLHDVTKNGSRHQRIHNIIQSSPDVT
jgi:ankyrin repeat protein